MAYAFKHECLGVVGWLPLKCENSLNIATFSMFQRPLWWMNEGYSRVIKTRDKKISAEICPLLAKAFLASQGWMFECNQSTT